jgi:hypothetical protein
MGSLEMDSKDDVTDSTVPEASFHVTYNEALDQWEPSTSSGRLVIPTVPTDAIREWTSKRMNLNGVQFVEGKPKLDDQGFMLGKKCFPPTGTHCDKCGASRGAAKLVQLPVLKVRTYNGCIRREQVGLKCQACSHVMQWDPASEYILTIRDGREGGNSDC